MQKEYHYKIIENNIRTDFRFIMDKGKVKYFCINVSLLKGTERKNVFRVDTAHKGLHFQKFWISNEPKYLENKRKDDYKSDFVQWKREVKENYRRWVENFRKKWMFGE